MTKHYIELGDGNYAVTLLAEPYIDLDDLTSLDDDLMFNKIYLNYFISSDSYINALHFDHESEIEVPEGHRMWLGKIKFEKGLLYYCLMEDPEFRPDQLVVMVTKDNSKEYLGRKVDELIAKFKLIELDSKRGLFENIIRRSPEYLL